MKRTHLLTTGLFVAGLATAAAAAPQSQVHELAAMAFADAADALTTVYPCPQGAEYDAHDLYQHCAAQLVVAGEALKDGVTDILAVLPTPHPLSVPALEALSIELTAAGDALAVESFDVARTHLLAFSKAMKDLKLADDVLAHHGFGVVVPSCEALARDLSFLGARRPAILEIFDLVALASTLPSGFIDSLVAPFAQIEDRRLLQMLRVQNDAELRALLALGTTLPQSAAYFAQFPGGTNGMLESFVSTGMSVHLYELGRGLATVAEELTTCVGGTPDCPDLCQSDAECGPCAPKELGFGIDSAGNLNPDDVDAVIGYGSLLIAIGSVAGPSLPGAPGLIMDAIDLAEAEEDIDNWRKAIKAIGKVWPSLWVKIEYHCCVVESCWDWGFCYFVTIYRNVCKTHVTDWKKSPDPLGYWTGPVQGGGSRLQKLMKQKADALAAAFCPTACTAPQ